jgi:hypothetical protein
MFKEACHVQVTLRGLGKRENTFSCVLWKTGKE